jgi:hypothetical protein
LKLLSNCSAKEKKEHNIHEEKNEIFVKIINTTEELKPISECIGGNITEKDGIFFVVIKTEE